MKKPTLLAIMIIAVIVVSLLGFYGNAFRKMDSSIVKSTEALTPVTVFDDIVSTKADLHIHFSLNESGVIIMLLYNTSPGGEPDWSQLMNNPVYAGIPGSSTIGNARVTIFGENISYLESVNVGNLWVTIGTSPMSNGNPQLLTTVKGSYFTIIHTEFAWAELYQTRNVFGAVCASPYCNMGYSTHFVDGTAQLRISFITLNMLTKITRTYYNYSPWPWQMPNLPDSVLVGSITGFSNSCGKDCLSSTWLLPSLQTGTVSYYSISGVAE